MIRLQPHHQSLVEGALGLVGKVLQAKRGNWWLTACDSLDDAYQAGVIGLCKAAARWESPRGLQFSTYAFPWIWQAIQLDIRYAGRWLVVESAGGMAGWRYELRHQLDADCCAEDGFGFMDTVEAQGCSHVVEMERRDWCEHVERRFLRVAAWLQREEMARLWMNGAVPSQIARQVGLSKQGVYDLLERIFQRTRMELEREGAA